MKVKNVFLSTPNTHTGDKKFIEVGHKQGCLVVAAATMTMDNYSMVLRLTFVSLRDVSFGCSYIHRKGYSLFTLGIIPEHHRCVIIDDNVVRDISKHRETL